MLAKFSEELKEAREKNGVTLQQVAAQTRIDIKFLTAMESGNFTFQPELYVKAFLKDYCRVIGIDEQKTLYRYELAKQGKFDAGIEVVDEGVTVEQKPPVQYTQPQQPVQPPQPKPVPQPQPMPAPQPTPTPQPQIKMVDSYTMPLESEPQKSSFNKNITALFAIVGAIAVIGAAVYFLFIKNSNDAIVSEKPYDQVLQENKNRINDDKPKAQEAVNTPPPASTDSLNLLIKANDTTWIRITKDSLKSEEFLLYPYSKKLVKAKKSFHMTLGNSGGVELTLNDKQLNFQGKRKKRAELLIDADGLKQLGGGVKAKNNLN
jgi:hypothetical protein